MWNNRRAFTGPGGSVRVVHHTSSESDTPQSHLCFPDSVSDSKPATVPVQPATQRDVSSSSLLLLRCAFFPPECLENKWNGLVRLLVCFQSGLGFCNLHQKAVERHETQRGTGSENTRRCLWNVGKLFRET